MKSLMYWLLVIAACVAVVAGLAYYKYSQIQAATAFGNSFGEPVQAVELFVAREERWQPTLTVTGELLATRALDLSTELPGRVVEVGFAPGARVEAGQVMLRLDTREERAMLAAALADAEIARLALARNERLIRTGAATEDARDQARAQFDAASAQVDRLRVLIDKKTLRTPFAARAGLHELQPGQYLDGGTVISHLVGVGEDIWVDFTLPQQQALLDVGAMVDVGFEHRPALRAEVIARDAVVNERSRNVRFRARAANPGNRLLPGMLVTVEVPIGAERTATVVPPAAVRRDAFGARVFVLRPAEEGAAAPERAEQRRVDLGPQRGSLVVITRGVEPGERVAANGAFKLRDGVLVRASDADAGGAAAQLAATGAL